MAALMLLLFSIGALIGSCNTEKNIYARLPEGFKKGVDRVMEMLRSDAENQTLVFHRSIFQSDIEPDDHVKYIYHHFYLKDCGINATACQSRRDRVVIDCGICYKTINDQIQPDPRFYVRCVNKKELTREIRWTRVEHCNRMGRRSGADSPLAQSEVNPSIF